MKRITSLVLALLAMAAIITGTAQTSQAMQLKGPAVYFVAHQDDETLSMAADIRAHVKAGRRVILVMMTKGDATGAWRPDRPLCATLGFCLDSAGIIAARNAEYRAAALALGVSPRNMYWENLQDGRLTVGQADAVVRKWISRYPSGSFKALSWLDDHPDHRAIANALRMECIDRHRIARDDCRFLQFSRYWTSKPINGGFEPGDAQVVAAMNEYSLFDPDHGRYAIGARFSVPTDFARMASDPKYQQSKWTLGTR